ncbi:MAG: NAD-binding protein [Methylococcales bacterium]|nr:NAD-binding protein [Methylococcales bacterium]
MISKLIVYAAYYLKSSDAYNKSKKAVFDLLENQRSPWKSYFDMFMIGLIVLSIVFLIYDVQHDTGAVGDYFEHTVLVVFVCEYLLRLWIYSDTHIIILQEHERAQYLNIRFSILNALWKAIVKKLEYIVSPFAIIDLLAILPSYRPLRILRIFLIFRLFKLFRYSNSAKLFSDILSSKRFELLTLLVFTCLLIFIASVSIYLFENSVPDGKINNLFDAFYWAVVTMTTVGYGDIVPYTTAGRLVAIILIFTSLGILAFFTSILIAAFNEKMPVLRENRTYAELERYKSFIIICGYGRVGQEIAALLSKDKQKFVIIDKQEQNVDLARKHGYMVIHADASKNEVLISAGICRGASTVLCITGDDVTNVYVTLTSRYLNKDVRIISRVNFNENVNKLYQAGADHVIRPFEVSGLLAAEFLGQPVAFEAITGILQNQTEIVMETLLVAEGSSLENKQIGQLELGQKKLTLLGVISANPIHLKHKNKYQVKQQHFYFNPEPEFVLRHEDMLVIFGRKYSIDHFRDQVEQSRLLGRKSA